jgi:predicted nucleotidyltransferase
MRDIAREQLLAELRALRPQFEREGVAHLALFGSRARGDHQLDSDVDLIVDVAEGRKFGLEAMGVALIVEDALGLESSVVTRTGLNENPAFRDRVIRDQIEVF